MPKNRRQFIKSTTATSIIVGSTYFANAQTANNNTIKIGLIGCGGRGTGAVVQALTADPNVRLWALADAFPEKITKSLNNLSAKPSFEKRIEVPAERQFSGFNAYQELIDSGVDVVLIAAPPGFRPQHLHAAIKAGKHVFAEKPMAVDMAGVKSVLASAKLADEKKISIQHGYCWRFQPGTRAAYGKVLAGDIGKVTSVYGTYYSGRVRALANNEKKPQGMADVRWQLWKWINFEWLSGGPLLEQCIHTVDKVAWAMNDVAPIAAVGNGGKHQRTDPGNVYDNYSVSYEYPDNVFCHVGQRQFHNCHNEIIDRVSCEGGTMVSPSRCQITDHTGKRIWRYKAADGEEQNMYQVCHNEFFSALREGKHINTGEYMANSTALGILGREAAHTGQRITWKQLFESNEDLAPDSLGIDDEFPIAPLPKAGVDQLV